MAHQKANKDEHWIDVCRRVLEEGPIKYNGSLVDAYTASGVVKMVDALNEEVKKKVLSCSFQKAVSVMWSVCR